ncbi:hydantoinase/oxoprolinase family protein [Georgenia sp. M64]|uniref:hydantoinase/oxoprolinase family protein n=1 Tax=Georgenia sp. M64 TaxID=3120520 RepID=UPI0030DEBA39
MRDIRIGIDVGGTFTDFAVVGHRADGTTGVLEHKTPSTPDEPARAVVTGLEELVAQGIDLAQVRAVAHGTTIGLNAIIQRSGARVTLVVSAGHRDLLEIGRARMPRSFDLHATPEVSPVPRDRVVEIAARLGFDGVPVAAPDDDELDRVARDVRATEPDVVALVLVGGFVDPAFEREVARGLRARLDGLEVVAAAATWPEIREYERGLVAVLEAYIHPLMTRYLTDLQERLSRLGLTAPLYITGSNGGTLSVAAALRRPLETVLSGPASGVTAAARTLGAGGRAVTFDMGGTSSDIAVVLQGRGALTTGSHVGGLPLILPVVDVNAIGAGGGSIAWIDTAGGSAALRVGPRSAGAVPGPACYGLGGVDATITDAYLVSGFIAPEHFLHGEVPLFRHRAVEALAGVADDLRLPGRADEDERAVAAADAVLRVATAQMATELRKRLAERGHEAADLTLVPFGGAGPTHAALLAEEVGVTEILVPGAAATYCALGAAVAPLRSDFARSLRRPLTEATFRDVRQVLDDLLARARAWIVDNGAPVEASVARVTADMRYLGQAYEITVPLAEGPLEDAVELTTAQVVAAFGAEHERLYDFSDPAATIEVATVRLAVVGPEPVLPVHERRRGAADGTGGAAAERRPLRWHGRWHETPVVERSAIGVGGAAVAGPALVEQGDTTVVVPPGWAAAADEAGNLRLRKDTP